MRVFRGLSNFKFLRSGCVVTIGNFDGVHRGHRMIIDHLARQGRRLGLPVVVMLFEPQPLEYFLGERAPSRLTRLREKVLRLSKLPVDYVVLLRFNRALANLEAEGFINTILLQGLGVKFLVVGDDFRFGRERRGDFAMLQRAGREAGFELENTPTFQLDGQRVSSTLIRDALEAGDMARAETLLGRPYSVCGRVAHGAKRGRTFGFPTANIRMFRKNSPINGVFAVTMSGVAATAIPGVANVGTRPTVDGEQSVLLETHLFDFDEDIYGRYVEVHFQAKIRDEQRFESIEALRHQIERDAAAARAILSAARIPARHANT